ncbi:PREDICTED: olfactory receptor 14J1-like [Ficedula albicollis]|uniref:olfactory receptor 14J1-like n=1 Tax=Ficedula albicollis TaxID=59894 RepID=UPI0007AD8240|nr:PREDICTED: olfactory receptor 14J1-like [Ficedula albicollis]
MHNSLWDTRNISYSGCAAQVFFFLFFMSTEYSLLTIMCYDRYVSICKPLHYRTLLGSRACAYMAAAAWASAFLYSLLHTANTFSLPLCHGNVLGQFFCEIPHILKLSCCKFYLREVGPLALSVCLLFGCFVFMVFSYVQIFRAVLRIPSEQGQHKAFSTCLPHLAVVSLFLSTAAFAHLKTPSISSPSLDLSLSVLYSVVPPALNPLIYSLRNQELKDRLRKIIISRVSLAPSCPNVSMAFWFHEFPQCHKGLLFAMRIQNFHINIEQHLLNTPGNICLHSKEGIKLLPGERDQPPHLTTANFQDL